MKMSINSKKFNVYRLNVLSVTINAQNMGVNLQVQFNQNIYKWKTYNTIEIFVYLYKYLNKGR